MSQLDFDATGVPPAVPFDPVPPGEYPAYIISSDLAPTKDGQGLRLKLEFEIADGVHKGRKIFDGLNLKSHGPNKDKTEAIAKSQLSAICHAVGKLQVGNSEELHGRLMLIKVVVKPASGEYQASNEVKGYKSANGAAPAPVPVGAAVGAAAPAAAAGLPWKK